MIQLIHLLVLHGIVNLLSLIFLITIMTLTSSILYFTTTFNNNFIFQLLPYPVFYYIFKALSLTFVYSSCDIFQFTSVSSIHFPSYLYTLMATLSTSLSLRRTRGVMWLHSCPWRSNTALLLPRPVATPR